MSAKKITIHAYRCKCELPDCPGNGKPWTSHGNKPPRACRWCKRITWNREDRRLKPKMTEAQRRTYNREKQAESRERKKKEKKRNATQPAVHQTRKAQVPDNSLVDA